MKRKQLLNPVRDSVKGLLHCYWRTANLDSVRLHQIFNRLFNFLLSKNGQTLWSTVVPLGWVASLNCTAANFIAQLMFMSIFLLTGPAGKRASKKSQRWSQRWKWSVVAELLSCVSRWSLWLTTTITASTVLSRQNRRGDTLSHWFGWGCESNFPKPHKINRLITLLITFIHSCNRNNMLHIIPPLWNSLYQSLIKCYSSEIVSFSTDHTHTDLPRISLPFAHRILHVPNSPNPPVFRRSSMSTQQANRVQLLQVHSPPPCRLRTYLLTKPPPPSAGENQHQKLLPLH